MKRWIIPFLLVTLMLMPQPARALSCIHPMERLPQMDLVVRGTITEIPKEHWAKVQVDRYYRGTGPATILVEFRGIDDDGTYQWAMTPQVGADALMELKLDDRGYSLGPCNLNQPFGTNDPPTQAALAQLGEGQAPDPNAAPAPALPGNGRMALWIGLALAGLAAGGLIMFRRRSQ